MKYSNSRKLELKSKSMDQNYMMIISDGFSKIILISLIYISIQFSLNAQNRVFETLPVELVYFYAEVYPDSVLLKFGTATEVSNYGFEVQRAQNNFNFEVIGFVDGNGNSNSPKDYTFTDSLVEMSGIIYYRLKQIDFNGSFDFSDTVTVNFVSDVKLENSSIPDKFDLSQNYPNPFNSTTKFQFNIKQLSHINLELFDINGQKMRTLLDGELYPGTYSYQLFMDDFSSGIYLVKFYSINYLSIKKILLLK
jgi:hypothetical protein